MFWGENERQSEILGGGGGGVWQFPFSSPSSGLPEPTRKGGGGKAGANPFGENNERRLHGFGAVHKPRGTVMQTEPMLKKHAT